jgi:hypothetical protein
MNNPEHLFTLEDDELEIVSNASKDHGVPFDPKKRDYTEADLSKLGIVREYYSLDELHQRGFRSDGVVSSFDDVSERAKNELRVGAPFANGVEKWQLPIDMLGFRIQTTIFPPNTTVLPHTHTILDAEIKSGGFRMVIQGSIKFEGKKYMPGDWFFIPNGRPYSFTTDSDVETEEAYWYGHRTVQGAVRISNPKSSDS